MLTMLKRFIFLNRNLELDLPWLNRQTKIITGLTLNTQDAIYQTKITSICLCHHIVKSCLFFLYLSVLHCQWILWKRNEMSTSCYKRFHYLRCCLFTTVAINNENIINIYYSIYMTTVFTGLFIWCCKTTGFFPKLSFYILNESQ
jgi:hypothetical protein